MGMYLNPGSDGFAAAVSNEYVDKTGLIALINHTINTKLKLTCVSRPRRFGKSYASQMLCAYYDKTCDSSALFAPYEIASDPSYSAYRNRFDVIYLDMTTLLGKTVPDKLISYMTEALIRELREAYPDTQLSDALDETLLSVREHNDRMV